MNGATILKGKNSDMQATAVIVGGKRNADALLPSTSPTTNIADEALYRHYPPILNNVPACNSGGGSNGSGDGTILETTNAYTFETLNKKLASRWCSSSPSPSPATAAPDAGSGVLPPSCCPPLAGKVHQAAATDTEAAKAAATPLSKGGPRATITRRPRATIPPASAAPAPCSSSSGGGGGSQLLFLVRHGETDMNKAGRLQGRGINAHLNDAGLEQARGLGRFMRNVPFDTVTSSSLHRAHETAMRVVENNDACARRAQENEPVVVPTTVAQAAGKEGQEEKEERTTSADFCCGDKAQVRVRKMSGLDELSWGVLEGKDSKLEPHKGRLAELKAAWDDGIFDRAAQGGENLVEVAARAKGALEDILDMGKELNLVVSHGRTLRILILSLTGLGMDQMTNWGKIPNCGTYILEVKRLGPGSARSYRLLPSCP